LKGCGRKEDNKFSTIKFTSLKSTIKFLMILSFQFVFQETRTIHTHFIPALISILHLFTNQQCRRKICAKKQAFIKQCGWLFYDNTRGRNWIVKAKESYFKIVKSLSFHLMLILAWSIHVESFQCWQ
jgi:predicted histidine transporter YuiF (NhaC family)